MIHFTSSSLCCYVHNPAPVDVYNDKQTSTNVVQRRGALTVLTESIQLIYLSRNSTITMKNTALQIKVLHSKLYFLVQILVKSIHCAADWPQILLNYCTIY